MQRRRRCARLDDLCNDMHGASGCGLDRRAPATIGWPQLPLVASDANGGVTASPGRGQSACTCRSSVDRLKLAPALAPRPAPLLPLMILLRVVRLTLLAALAASALGRWPW